jgi:hypothetical protein
MYKVFANRWEVLYVPIMTVDFKLHPEFCRRDTDIGTDADFDKVITDLVKVPGTPSVTLMKLQYEEFRISCKTGRHTCGCVVNSPHKHTYGETSLDTLTCVFIFVGRSILLTLWRSSLFGRNSLSSFLKSSLSPLSPAFVLSE